ncbi:MAG: hypothetical protein KF764_29210 [Labilithrix sp.]|nr:hypothetical protein [Labilithrix sp.]
MGWLGLLLFATTAQAGGARSLIGSAHETPAAVVASKPSREPAVGSRPAPRQVPAPAVAPKQVPAPSVAPKASLGPKAARSRHAEQARPDASAR